MVHVALAALLPLALLAAPALASDGAIELNHTCATTAGCLPGDTGGYPITANAPGSYRLTSNLTVPASTQGIEFASNASLDLGGFEIAGPVTCPAGVCPPAARLAAVSGVSNITVTNGRVRGFEGTCIKLGLGARVERVQVSECADDGIHASGDSLVASNQIRAIGDNGIVFAVPAPPTAAGLYRDNAIGQTGGISVLNGRASGPNTCVDQKCGTSGKKFFYLTTTTHTGAQALNACAAGFHFASLYEIFETTALEYDTTRGDTAVDSGEGTPSRPDTGEAWIRTGFQASAAATAGVGNCTTWTSSAGADSGSTAQLNQVWGSGGTLDPWSTATDQCSMANEVWCIQN